MVGLPAGTTKMAPAGGGTCRFTPSYSRSSSSGGREKRMSRWWVRAGAWSSEAGTAQLRAASRPTHPSRSLEAAGGDGRSLNQSRGLIGAPGCGFCCRIVCLPLRSLADGVECIDCHWVKEFSCGDVHCGAGAQPSPWDQLKEPKQEPCQGSEGIWRPHAARPGG